MLYCSGITGTYVPDWGKQFFYSKIGGGNYSGGNEICFDY